MKVKTRFISRYKGNYLGVVWDYSDLTKWLKALLQYP